MKYYLAPMEEITTYLYRNVVTEMFGAPDRCFAPFIAPTQKVLVRKRERNDISPEHNDTSSLVPQILTQHADAFCEVARFLYEQGYREVNLNLGCPSGTVTAKGKGSGFLKEPALLRRFLESIFEYLGNEYGSELKISVKTRIGFESEDEFPMIWSVLTAFPFSEIILHPRLRTDFYKGSCRMDAVAYALSHETDSRIVYNGDIRCPADVERLNERFPQISHIMIGRGMVRNPGLIRQLRTGQTIKKDEYRALADRLYQAYADLYHDEHNAIHKMKELWTYMAESFADADRPLKKLLKSKTPAQYHEAEDTIFACELKDV